MMARLPVVWMAVVKVVEGNLRSGVKHGSRGRIMLMAHAGSGGMVLLMVMVLLAMMLLILLLLVFVAQALLHVPLMMPAIHYNILPLLMPIVVRWIMIVRRDLGDR